VLGISKSKSGSFSEDDTSSTAHEKRKSPKVGKFLRKSVDHNESSEEERHKPRVNRSHSNASVDDDDQVSPLESKSQYNRQASYDFSKRMSKSKSSNQVLSSKPKFFTHSSAMSEDDMDEYPRSDHEAVGEIPKSRPKLTFTLSKKSLSGSPKSNLQIRIPLNSDWNVKCVVKRVFHPARKLSKRLRLRELFIESNFSPVDFKVVKKAIEREDEGSQQLSASYPYLPRTQCAWKDLQMYLKYNERFKQTRTENVDVTLELIISDKKSSQSCEYTCNVNAWMEVAMKKVGVSSRALSTIVLLLIKLTPYLVENSE
jgi:hypothetical protein